MERKPNVLINLTPHPIDIYDPNGQDLITTIPSSGCVRVNTSSSEVGVLYAENSAISIVETAYGSIDELPDPEDETFYIVSPPVIAALKAAGIKRLDVIAPDSNPGSVVRDNEGKIIGVRRFTR